MTAKEIAVEESFLIQSHALVECLDRLGKMEAEQDPDFEKLKDKVYGRTAKQIRISDPNRPVFTGHGALLAEFYLLLVIPTELTKPTNNRLKGYDLREAEAVAERVKKNDKTTYERPKPTLRHFRNALSHGRVGWKDDRLVITDESAKKEEFSAEFEMNGLQKIVRALNEAFANYVATVIARRK